MSLELLQNIEGAEQKAEETRARAQKEARDLIQSVEEACVSSERSAALENRALVQRVLEDARTTAQKRIDEDAQKEARKREQMMQAARAKLDDAAKLIYERTLDHGHR